MDFVQWQDHHAPARRPKSLAARRHLSRLKSKSATSGKSDQYPATACQSAAGYWRSKCQLIHAFEAPSPDSTFAEQLVDAALERPLLFLAAAQPRIEVALGRVGKH